MAAVELPPMRSNIAETPGRRAQDRYHSSKRVQFAHTAPASSPPQAHRNTTRTPSSAASRPHLQQLLPLTSTAAFEAVAFSAAAAASEDDPGRSSCCGRRRLNRCSHRANEGEGCDGRMVSPSAAVPAVVAPRLPCECKAATS